VARPQLQGFRPDAGERAEASAALARRGRTMSDYLRACLRWLRADPDTALATLDKHWPEPRPRPGRPRKDAAATAQDAGHDDSTPG